MRRAEGWGSRSARQRLGVSELLLAASLLQAMLSGCDDGLMQRFPADGAAGNERGDSGAASTLDAPSADHGSEAADRGDGSDGDRGAGGGGGAGGAGGTGGAGDAGDSAGVGGVGGLGSGAVGGRRVDGGTDAARRVLAEDFTGALNAASFAASVAGSSPGAASALAAAAGRIVAVNPDSDSVTVVDEASGDVLAEIAVGDDPRTLAVTGDGRYAVVVNRGDATVSLVDLIAARELFHFEVGPMPYGVALVGRTAYVTEMARGDLAVLDLVTRTFEARLPVGDSPAGIAACAPPRCALTGGDALLVTQFYSGALTIVDRHRLRVVATLSTGADTNLSQFIILNAAGTRAYLPQTRFNVDNPNRQFDTTVFPVVNVIELGPAPRLLNAARITLDTADRPVAMPFAVALSGDEGTLWVANAASDDVSVIDLSTQLKRAHVSIGANPRGLLLSADGRRAYVNETLDGTLAVIDAATFLVTARVTLTRLPLDARTLTGKRIFHSATRTDLAKDQWMSCATCHFDGSTDRRTWLSFPDGPRNTTALFNLADTLPLHWSGDLDELADVEATIRFIQAGTGLATVAQLDTLGLPLAAASADLDALAHFIGALPAPPSPFQKDDPDAVARGRATFDSLDCQTCHASPRYTDRVSHDVGTGDPAVERNAHGRGTSFDTPSLRALWLTPPYLHDGSAETLFDVLARGAVHDISRRTNAATRADVVAFLLSL